MGGLAKNINIWITGKEMEITQTCDKENIYITIWEIKIKTTSVHPCNGQKLKHLIISNIGQNVRKQLSNISKDSDLNVFRWGQASVLF